MKTLFLDIDGVLNTHEGTLDDRMIGRLRRLLAETGALVVLSSSWKLRPDSRAFVKEKVCDFIDVTPDIPINILDPTQRRGVEVDLWLRLHPEVERYAILDDTGWFFEHQLPNLFKTKSDTGLTDEIVERIIRHFKT